MLRNKYPDDFGRVIRMSMFNDDGYKKLKTAHLCIIGCRSVNGVASIHTDILKNSVYIFCFLPNILFKISIEIKTVPDIYWPSDSTI